MEGHIEKTALVVMDVQPSIVERIQNKEQYLQGAETTVAAVHELKMLVVYVVVGFRPGLPEISADNQSFGSIKASERAAGMVNPAPALEPTENDIVVTKRRVSAFSGSDLEVVLRAQNVRHLVLAGIATSGVVLSTVREAADKDYRLTVLADLCVDFDDETHRLLIEKVFPRQSTVTTSDEWINSLKTKRGK
jgi:nicotinamidase-related amidase